MPATPHLTRRPRRSIALTAGFVLVATAGAAVTQIVPSSAAETSSSSSSDTLTVAADGSAEYSTVQAAVDAVPTGNDSRVTIEIDPGTYREIVTIPSTKPYVTLTGTGDSAEDVVIVNNHANADYGTAGSASVFVYGSDFAANNLTFSNDFTELGVNNGDQAVALNVSADRAVFDHVRLLGDQDTLLINSGRSYFRYSFVQGTVDFIFGAGTAVFDGCSLYEKRTTGGPITAAKTDGDDDYGFLIYQSSITGKTDGTVQLGRPWGADAQVVVRESTLSAGIDTDQPWIDMSGNDWEDARFFEYDNTGDGATTNSNRPQLSSSKASAYTPEAYLAGDDDWDPVD